MPRHGVLGALGALGGAVALGALLHFGLRATGHPDALLARAWDLVLLTALLTSAFALGSSGLRWLGVELDLLPRLLARLALGLALDSLLGILLALAHLFRRGLLVAIVFAPLVLLSRADLDDLRRAASLARRALASIAGLLLLGFIALYLALAASPASGIDALAYHLVGQQEYLRAGGIPPETANPLTFLPNAGSVLYGILMAAGSDFLPKLLNCAFLLLAIGALAALARGRASRRTAALACLLLVGQWECFFGVQRVNVDFHAVFYGLLSLGLTLDWVQRRSVATPGQAALLGLLLGTAMAGKYTAIYTVLGIELLLLVGLLARRIGWRSAVIANALALLAFLPLLARNAAFTGDPLFPALTTTLGTHRIFSGAQLAAWQGMHGIFVPRVTPASFLLMPFWANRFGRYPSVNFDGPLDAWLLLGPAVALLLTRRARWLLLLYAFLGAFYLAWLSTAILRYALPAYAVASLLAALCVVELPPRIAAPGVGALVRRPARGLVYAFAAYTLTAYALGARPLLAHGTAAFLGLEDRRAYLELGDGGRLAPLDDLLNTRTRPDDRIFAVLADQSYYLHRFMKADPTRTNIALLRAAQDPIAWLRGAGFQYVLVDLGRYRWIRSQRSPIPELNPYPEAMAGLEDLWAYFTTGVVPRLTPAGAVGPYRLFAVPAAPTAPGAG